MRCYTAFLTIDTEPKSMSQLRPHDQIVFTDFDGSEGILVDLNTKKYYQLNETATVIWKGVERGLAAREIADEIVAVYEINSADALFNVEATLDKLKTYRLIVLQQSAKAS